MIIKRGNKKIGKDTFILNMGSAAFCPSRLRGMCKHPDKCYAYRDEKRYCRQDRPNVLDYHLRQAAYWKNTSAREMIKDLRAELARMRRPEEIQYFRYNESGDMYSKRCLNKMISIARAFPEIQFYTYTHRLDIMRTVSAKALPKNLCINISNAYLYGYNSFMAVHEYTKAAYHCAGDCRICNLCKHTKGITVEVMYH